MPEDEKTKKTALGDDIEIVEDEPVEEKTDIVEEEEEEGYSPKAKPKLTKEEAKGLHNRADKKRNTPKFRRQEWFRYDRLDEHWRKPRGLHSKTRKNYRYRPAKVSKGYRGPRLVRGRHPSGFEEVLVFSPKELENLDPERQAVRIGHKVGTRKRMDIKEKADEMGIRILNWGS